MNRADRCAFLIEIVGEHWCTARVADGILARAEALQADPLHVTSVQYGVPVETLYERVATLLELRYSEAISRHMGPLDGFTALESIPQVQMARGAFGGRRVVFAAPGFDQLFEIRAKLANRADLRRQLVIVAPRHLRMGLAKVNETSLLTNAYQGLVRAFPFGNAHLDLPLTGRIAFVALLAAIVLMALIVPFAHHAMLTVIFTLILVTPSAFRVWAALTAARNTPIDTDILLSDAHLPIYSVLIPLRDEAHMVPQIVAAMKAFDYPKEKLDILFVVESESTATIEAVNRGMEPGYMDMIVVPRGGPATKPKAINFALPIARGDHVVVFDAEDRPDPGQLRKAASLFAQFPAYDCLQAELVIENAETNFLTRMFAAEYAGHFGLLLPALARLEMPLPLGGTSNHFRLSTLRRIGAWDSFNVTEDADLGIRLARLDRQVKSFASYTYETAPTTLGVWVRQRTRWQKGWMQTLIVHGSRPVRLWRTLGATKFAAFWIFVGSMVFSTAIHGPFFMLVAAILIWELATLVGPSTGTLLNIVLLFLGYMGAAAAGTIGLARLNRSAMSPILIGLPIHWLLCWLAVFLAAIELIHRPFYWAKTAHSVSNLSKPKKRKSTIESGLNLSVEK